MAYIGNENQQIKATRSTFTASGAETSVTVNYTVGQLSVFLNGIKLIEGSDYTATNGTSIALAAALATDDVLDFISLGDFEVADVVPTSGGTFSGAVTFSSTLTINSDITGSVLPSTDDTYDLGSATKQWQNIYTGDLHLTNERGSWTVIEEEDYLTLRNNKTDKVYKLVMEEIE